MAYNNFWGKSRDFPKVSNYLKLLGKSNVKKYILIIIVLKKYKKQE